MTIWRPGGGEEGRGYGRKGLQGSTARGVRSQFSRAPIRNADDVLPGCSLPGSVMFAQVIEHHAGEIGNEKERDGSIRRRRGGGGGYGRLRPGGSDRGGGAAGKYRECGDAARAARGRLRRAGEQGRERAGDAAPVPAGPPPDH